MRLVTSLLMQSSFLAGVMMYYLSGVCRAWSEGD